MLAGPSRQPPSGRSSSRRLRLLLGPDSPHPDVLRRPVAGIVGCLDLSARPADTGFLVGQGIGRGALGEGIRSTPYSALVSSSPPRTSLRAPSIGDLIDLELVLEQDREQPLEMLLVRDARIAREIGAADRTDRELVLAWLDRVRASDGSTGRAVEGLLRLVSLLLVVTGLASGLMGVAGWLWTGRGAVVNVMQLWPALVGLQVVLALSWVGFRAVPRRLSASLHEGLSTWLPAACGALASRLARPGLREAWHRFQALDRVYGGLRFWRLTKLTQSLAIAFNVGALAALLLIPIFDDPAFGWRSRLLDADGVHTAVRWLAAPWAALWPDAAPTLAEIRATEASSLTPAVALAQPARAEVWAAWWPFLVASFLVYGLLPRLLLWGVGGWRVRGLLRAVAFDHEACVRLRERLRRPLVDGRTDDPDAAAGAGAHPPEVVGPMLELPARVRVVRWAGVPLEPDDCADRIASGYGVMVESTQSAGGLELAADDRALEALRGAEGVFAIVEAWEAPGADYRDFLRALRSTIGERVPLWVLPCEVSVDGRPTAVEPRHLSLWRRQLGELADPWLRVEPFPEAGSP